MGDSAWLDHALGGAVAADGAAAAEPDWLAFAVGLRNYYSYALTHSCQGA